MKTHNWLFFTDVDDEGFAEYGDVESVKKLTFANQESKPVLHIKKGKYFKNDNLPADIETDGQSFSRSMNQWFWKDDKGNWNPFPREMNNRVDKYYSRDPKSTVIVTIKEEQ